MSLIQTNLDYSTKDQAALERRLRSLIDSVFPNWSEKTRANFGNIMLGLFAYVGDIHTYYVDQWARESRITTAQLRRSLLGLVKLINYQPESASAATVDVTLTLSVAAAATVTIAAGRVVRTQGSSTPVEFQLLEDAVFSVGQTVKTVSVEHSETHEEALTSDGLPNQVFRLRFTPMLEQEGESPTVVFANGEYTRVDNFLDSTSSDRHFVLQVDSDDRGTIIFGDGVLGAIPQGTGEVTYKTGGGAEGNVEAGTLKVLEGAVTDANGNVVTVTVNNSTAASGGAPRQSNASIRQLAPKAARVLNRAIAREDFEIVAEQVAGVARALHITSEEDDAVGENQGYLFIIPEGGGTASEDLLDEVKSHFFEVDGYAAPDYPTINTFDLQVQTAAYFTINHTVRAFRAAGYTNAQMKAAIDDVLEDFYAVTIAASRLIEIAPKVAANNGITAADGDSIIQNPLVDFGFGYKDSDGTPTGVLAWSDVFNVLRDLPQVRKLDADDGLLLNSVREDVEIGTFKFPVRGTVVVVDGNTGQTIT